MIAETHTRWLATAYRKAAAVARRDALDTPEEAEARAQDYERQAARLETA